MWINLSVFGCQDDLVNTIGEAAALGAAGVVSWGDMQVTQDEVHTHTHTHTLTHAYTKVITLDTKRLTAFK